MNKVNELELLKAVEMLNNLPVPTKKRYFRLPDGSTVTNDPAFYKNLSNSKGKRK